MKTWTTDSVKSVLTMLGSTGKKTWAIGSVNSVLMLGSTGMKVWTTGSVNSVCSYYTVSDEWQKMSNALIWWRQEVSFSNRRSMFNIVGH